MSRVSYSSQQIYAMWSMDLRPSRSLRKSLFSAHLWVPRTDRLRLCPSGSSTAPAPLLDTTLPLSASAAAFSPMLAASMPVLAPPSLPYSSSTSSSSASSTSSPSPTSSVPSSSGLRAAIWNARSLSNKFAFIGQTILDHNLDIFAVTETWHWGSDDVPVCRATPPGFTFCDRPRPLPLDVSPTQGGGIVIYLRSTLRFSRITLDMEITSFEALCLSIATPRGSLTVLTVYRPGSITPPDIFFTEFASVLESLVTRNTQLLIVGDFNIHLEDPSLSSTSRFLDILSQFGLCQHATGATHKAGHSLDLVITSDEVVPDDLKVYRLHSLTTR